MPFHEELARLLTSIKAILFDFDGPICDLFYNYSPQITAAHARARIADAGICLPAELRDTPGGLALVKWSHVHTPQIADDVEAIQEVGEIYAADTSRPTAHSTAAIVAARQSGMKLAIVSNNSTKAIRKYLRTNQLDSYFEVVIGRDLMHVARMKPSPWALISAAQYMNIDIGHCVMLGDSATDMEAARQAGALPIGMSNNESTSGELREAGAVAVISTILPFAQALNELARTPNSTSEFLQDI